MEEETTSKENLHLQYLEQPTVFQYNTNGNEHLYVADCTFEDEVRKSAIDITKWEEDQKKKRQLIESGKHPFLTNSLSSEVTLSADPIMTIVKQISQAKAEMQLVQQLLRDIHAPAGSDPVFRQTMHIIPSEEKGDDLEKTRKTRIANLESTFVLFEDATNQLQENIQQLQKRIDFQRHYFNDLYNYSKYFNIVTFHSASLSFIRNEDCLLLHCGYTNNRDFSSCLRVFTGDDGYLLLKPHNASCYSYLTITTGIIDESRIYESSYSYHTNEVSQSVYSSLLNELSRYSSIYTKHNLHCINSLRHSILCRQIFNSLASGCSELLHSKDNLGGWKIQIGDNELIFTIDESFFIRVCLTSVEEPLSDEIAFSKLIHENMKGSSLNGSSSSTQIASMASPTAEGVSATPATPMLPTTQTTQTTSQVNYIYQVLTAFNHNVILYLIKQQYKVYNENPHHKRIQPVHSNQEKDSISFVQSILHQFSFLYYKLFIKYFLYVLNFQFDHLVYSNVELTESRMKMKYHYVNQKAEIEVIFSTIAIANIIIISSQGVFINGIEYHSLFSAFSGILAMFMQQIRLLYLYCINHIGIARDLGNDLAVINGNGKVTVISFVYSVPTLVAFYHAFIFYCKQGKLINKDAGWIAIRRKDREKQPLCKEYTCLL